MVMLANPNDGGGTPTGPAVPQGPTGDTGLDIPSVDKGNLDLGTVPTPPKKVSPPTDPEKIKTLLEEGRALLEGGMTIEELMSSRPLIAATFSQEYGYALSLLTSDKSLMQLFSKAVREGATAEGFTNALKGTDWWTSRTTSQRQYDIAANTPGEKKNLDVRRQEIINEMKSQAMQVNGMQLDDATAYKYADDILRNHWEQQDWGQFLPNFVRKTFVDANAAFDFGGQAGQTLDALRKYANDMGVFMGDASLGVYVDKIFADETTAADVEKMIQQNAASYYTQFADRITAGETVKDIVSPYRQMIASMLDLPDPNAVDFINNDGTPAETLMQKALFGGQNGKAMSLYDLQKEIRRDSRWLQSSNARSEYTDIATQLKRTFGGGF